MRIDVYDFDGTIYDGDSTVDFVFFCLRRHPGVIAGLPQFWEYLEFSIKFVRVVLIYFRIFAPLLNIEPTNFKNRT